MITHEPTLDITSARAEARHWLSITLGPEVPLIDAEIAAVGTPALIAAAAHARLAELRVRAWVRVRRRQRMFARAESGRHCNTETDT